MQGLSLNHLKLNLLHYDVFFVAEFDSLASWFNLDLRFLPALLLLLLFITSLYEAKWPVFDPVLAPLLLRYL